MKIARLVAVVFLALAPFGAYAQTPAPAAAQQQTVKATGGWDASAPMTATVVAPKTGGGVINIGQAFGDLLQPYVDAAANAAILGIVSWLAWLLKNKFGIDTDAKMRDALTAYLQNSASSLIAAGAVSVKDKTVTVRSEALAAEVNSAMARIPDTLKHFGLDPQTASKLLGDKIMDAVAQVPAGAAIIAQAHAETPNSAQVPAPETAADRPAEPAVVIPVASMPEPAAALQVQPPLTTA